MFGARLPQGEAQTDQTIAAMFEYVRHAMRSPAVVAVKEEIMRLAWRAPGDVREESVDALFRWARRHFTFKLDPDDIEVGRPVDEILAAVARDGVVAIDCKKLAVVCGSILVAMGSRPIFEVCSQGGEWEHVYCLVQFGAEQPVAFDPQETNALGDRPRGALLRKVYIGRV